VTGRIDIAAIRRDLEAGEELLVAVAGRDDRSEEGVAVLYALIDAVGAAARLSALIDQDDQIHGSGDEAGQLADALARFDFGDGT
jgi:hypothetical protein